MSDSISISEFRNLTRKRARYSAATSSHCQEGHWHQSKLEAAHCNQLFAMKRGGAVKEVETQVKYRLEVNGALIATHYVDFRVTLKDGSIMVVETKGKETDRWRMLHRLFQAIYPDIPYEVWK